ncbi:zinc finger protein 235-like [Sabethes cyaneus]|uniref:zinc finger protein 235-like n=1 Tax=Sabethes cyaneus TaxID=53552 RepID=UPI00237D4FE3|nr:zinc finger protein 235-like [Sabethes cyaneus]
MKESETAQNSNILHFDIVMNAETEELDPSVKLEECTGTKVQEVNITEDTLVDTEDKWMVTTYDLRCSDETSISVEAVSVVKQEPAIEIADGSDNTENLASVPAAANGETAIANSSDVKRFGWNHAHGDQDKSVTTQNKQLEKPVCTICGKAWMTNSRLAVHMRVHTGERPYKCNNCSKTFKSAETRNAHWLAVHSGEKKFKCEICDKSFPYKATLKIHRAVHGVECRHECSHCGKKFVYRSALETHMKRHGLERSHKCPICDKAFQLRFELKRHMFSHIKKERLKCDICGASFGTACALKEHKLSHTRLEAFYKCDICDGQYSSIRGLQAHKKLHTNERRFFCSCGKNFPSRETLVKHRLSKCKDRPFKCTVCAETFRSEQTLRLHASRHNNGLKQCEICFKWRFNLTLHRRTHKKVSKI